MKTISSNTYRHRISHPCGIPDYLLVLFIVLWSGGGFTYGLFKDWQTILLPIVLILLLIRKEKINQKDFIFPIVLVGLIFLQSFTFMSSFSPATVMTPIFGILTVLCITKILRWNFYKVFGNIMVAFAFTSLMLWFIDAIPSGHSALLSISDKLPQLGWDIIRDLDVTSTKSSNTLYLYRVDYVVDNLPLNSGPFWEHGRFAIYLVIALFLSIVNERKIVTVRNLILLVATVTTFSTTAYIALVTMSVCLLLIRNGLSWKTLLLAVGMYFVIIYISQLDFMTEKVQEDALDLNNTQSRFGAMAYHFLQISKSPWIGFGPFLYHVFGEIEISPNGWTDLIRYWGIPMAIYMFYLIYRSACGIMHIKEHRFAISISFFIVVMLLSFPQTIMTSPFYYFIYFMAFERDRVSLANFRFK